MAEKQVRATTESDPFDGHDPVTGLEHLGRAIVDANGYPSGSPANFEHLRGQGGEPAARPLEDVLADLVSDPALQLPFDPSHN